MKNLILTLTLIVVALESVLTLDINRSWNLFKERFNKTYVSATEERNRLGVFAKNVALIDEHNARAKQGLETYELGINPFADMTFSEFSKKYLGFKFRPSVKAQTHVADASEEIPPIFEKWLEIDILTNIKDQGSCGSCWAFSAISSIEFAYTQLTGEKVEFSEQNCMDCSWYEGSRSCNGGWMPNCYESIKRTGGLMTAEDYPYKGKDDLICKTRRSKTKITVTDYVTVEGDQNLKSAIIQKNVAIAMEVEKSFQHYKSGIYSTDNCKNTNSALNHAVNAVGFGIFTPEGSNTTSQYWQVRNSWSEKWGEKGYVRMEAGKCGVGKIGFYPIVKIIKS